MAERPRILEGRRGLVLGMSSQNSLGYHCAATFAALGADVAVSSRPATRELRATLAAEAGCVLQLDLDADDDESIAAAFALLEERWGRLDFLVHTLVHVPEGVLSRPLVEVSRQEFRMVMESGVHSLLAVCRHAQGLLERSESPRLVALTSPADHLMTPNYHVVGLAKAALAAAVLYLAYELGPRGILCNAVSFSVLPTTGAQRVVGAETATATHAYLAKRAPTRQALDASQVAQTIAFLASALCDNMTGEVITVDGGFSRTYFCG